MGAYCTFPKTPPFNPIRLASNYRDTFGDAHALLTEMTDAVIKTGCYVPRIFHAPDTSTENTGVAPNGYLEYALALPAGSFILGFLHAFCSGPSANNTDPPVTSGFRAQITDIKPNYQWFGKPVPEAYFLNDIPTANPSGNVSQSSLVVPNPSVRLLAAPYPVTPPGILKIEFWNILQFEGAPVVNDLVRLSFLVAVPDPDMKGTS